MKLIRKSRGRLLNLCVIALLVAFQLPLFGQETIQPESSHQISGPVIAKLLGRYHYNDQKINDNVSVETLDLYLQSLDRNRIYFLASDIARFEKYRQKLDDEVLTGNFEAPYIIFNTLKQRMDERIEYVMQRLQTPFDFTVEETYALDRSEAPWVRSKQELDELWRKKLKNEALNLKLDGKEWEGIKSTLERRYTNLHKRIDQYNSEDVFQVFMNSLSETYDPHTSYFSPITSENFGIEMSLSFEGIGAQLTTEDEYTKVVRILPGGPAERSKELWDNDKIVGVAQGQDGEMEDVVGMRLDDVVQKIRGPKGSIVRLEIIPADTPPGSPTKEVVLKRDKIVLEERAAKSDTVEITHEGELYRLGVITIPSFYIDMEAQRRGDPNYKSTTRDVKRLIKELQSAGIDGLIIDLRRNGGGSLQEAIELTGLFIEEGPVVQVKDLRGKKGIEYDPDSDINYNGPLAVMVDRFSASASEIFASAIQDYGRGIIIGSQTYGKGTVQRLLDLDRFINTANQKYGQLKVTTAKFYRITGGTTQHRGVIPDINFPSLYNEMEDFGEDNELHALPWDEISPTRYEPDDRVSKYIAALRTKSNQRTATTREFQYIHEDIDRYKEDRVRNAISLQEAERRAKRERLQAQKLARANERRQARGQDPLDSVEDIPRDAPEPDPWLEESQLILADYIALAGTKSTSLTKTDGDNSIPAPKRSETVEKKVDN